MNPWRITFIALAGGTEQAGALASQFTSNWPGVPPLITRVVAAGAFGCCDLEETDAVIVAPCSCDQADAVLQGLLILLATAGLPTIFLRGDGDATDLVVPDGLIDCPDNAPPDFLCGMLIGMLARESELDLLRSQIDSEVVAHDEMTVSLRRLERELASAGRVQEATLRSLPEPIHGVTMAVLWRPLAWVSGDVYEVRRVDDDRILMVLGDACGHGLPAAMLGEVLRRACDDATRPGGVPAPAMVLEYLNAALLAARNDVAPFATALSILLNARTGVVTCAAAGHPSPIIVDGSGTARRPWCEGPALGIFNDATWKQTSRQLLAHDRLLLITDGIEDLIAPGDPGHAGRLLGAAAVHGAAADVPAAVSDLIDETLGTLRPQDDFTVLCAAMPAMLAATASRCAA